MVDFLIVYADAAGLEPAVAVEHSCADVDRAAALGLARCPDGMFVAAVVQVDRAADVADALSHVAA